MHPYDEACEHVQQQNDTEEARAWLARVGKTYGVVHEMSYEETADTIEECYMRGAALVEVVGKLPEEPSECNADMLLLTLPKEPFLREQLFDLEKQIAEISGYDMSLDENQKYILLRWT